MSLARIKDVIDAHDAGRVHVQRFFKNASTTGDTQWIDWSFASGQPAYDARIGTALKFTPFVAQRNDAVWFPGIGAGQERRLTDICLVTTAGGANQASVDAVLYDLVGVYPLIDGDSTDAQPMDNSDPLPRYQGGAGVFPVLVNHVAPLIGTATGSYTYTDASGVQRTSSFAVAAAGANKVCSGGGNSIGALTLPGRFDGGGVRSIDSLTFDAAPGGLFAIYMVRLLDTITNVDGSLATSKCATEKSLLEQSAWRMPLIPDGAWLGFFIRPNGGSTTVLMFGHMTFVWG